MGALQLNVIPFWRTVRVLLAVLIGGIVAGCGSTSSLERQTAGKTVSYAPGLPNFDMEIIPKARRGTPGIDLNIGVPYRSLIYVRDGDAYTADFELMAQILDSEAEYIIETTSWRDSVIVSKYARTRGYETFPIRHRINLPAGEYVFRVVLRDRNSEKQAERFKRVAVPAYNAGKPLLGHLFMERVEAGQTKPVVSLHVPSNLDTLRVVTELYNADPFDEIEVQLAVIRFDTDADVASPPYWITPYAGSLAYEGVDYSEGDTISTSRYTLENLSNQAELRFTLPDLERGMYRINLEAYLRQVETRADSVVLQESRDLSVKGADFPSIVKLDEVIEALTYIARKREVRHIREPAGLDERRKRFDAFWGELVGERREARRLLRTYYSRVEEANLFFTSHKAGWKTDRGMVYVVMGAPAYVERYVDAEIWHYSYTEDPLDQFVFERVNRFRTRGATSVNNYLLIRRPYYERTWQRAVQQWRNGTVL